MNWVSVYWINQNNLTKEKFIWQDDYWVVGVSKSHDQFVRNYIHNQKEHHAKQSFRNEIDVFINKYGWE